MQFNTTNRFLNQLARLYGVQTVFFDATRTRRQASIESVVAVLKQLGAPLKNLEDVPSALREKHQSVWRQMLEPVIVAWDGAPLIDVRLPTASGIPIKGEIDLENGERRSYSWDSPLVLDFAQVDGVQYVLARLTLTQRLPQGYHKLRLKAGGKSPGALIISAPVKAYSPPELDERLWGAFIPLYALYSRESWGSGDFSDFSALAEWLATAGGRVLATLPFLAGFLDEPLAPSPYTPASRLLWNEFYLDIASIPELKKCPVAQAFLESSSFRVELNFLRESRLVDYRRQMELKRRVLEELCHCLYSQNPARLEAHKEWAQANPVAEDYAQFRAAMEKQHAPWRSWRTPLRDGILEEGDYDEEARRYHLYAQWLVHEQVQALAVAARRKGVRLYLDLPLGVHRDGYDVWRERSSFATNTSVGAPPDLMFTAGQNWEFPPLHPEKIREQGYRYVIAYLRHHLKHSGILRIDHIMGLHRLYWIPDGMPVKDGVYVHYHPDELYAILTLESHRHESLLVGEDLGTVPPEVRPAMNHHGFHRMYVAEYELHSPASLSPIPRNSVASLSTHDMPPFASFWEGLDIDERLKLGLLGEAAADKERQTRQKLRQDLTALLYDKGWLKGAEQDIPAIMNACISLLAASRGRVLLVNLEDLWLETQPQNVPSTGEGYPNWRRKARYALDEFCQMPAITATLQKLNRIRKHQHGAG